LDGIQRGNKECANVAKLRLPANSQSIKNSQNSWRKYPVNRWNFMISKFGDLKISRLYY
jgi:hypothetical protein